MRMNQIKISDDADDADDDNDDDDEDDAPAEKALRFKERSHHKSGRWP